MVYQFITSERRQRYIITAYYYVNAVSVDRYTSYSAALKKKKIIKYSKRKSHRPVLVAYLLYTEKTTSINRVYCRRRLSYNIMYTNVSSFIDVIIIIYYIMVSLQ